MTLHTDHNDLTVKRFSTTINLMDRDWFFDVRLNSSRDLRFEGKLSSDIINPSGFVIIRSTIGKWLISGDGFPHELQQFANMIGKKLEYESSKLKTHHSSGFHCGEMVYEALH